MKKIAVLFLLVGFCSFLYTGIIYFQRTNPSRLSFDVAFTQQKQEVLVSPPPKRIVIPKISVNVPVISSSIKKGEWETTMEGVSYLGISPIPGDRGNSILYGHNFDHLFGKLPKLSPGDVIEIEYEDSSKKEFVIHFTQVVTPKQVDIVKATSDTRITLYTCTGFLDSKRFVVVAKPKA